MQLYLPKAFHKAPVTKELIEQEKETYCFYVVGDRCGIPIPHRFEQAMDMIAKQEGDFVVGIGDYVDGYWLDEASAHEEWKQTEDKINRCGKPFFHTVGNHDYGNKVMQKVWHERKGADYYAMKYQQDLFCFINTEDPSALMPDWIGEKIREISRMLEEKEDQLDVIIPMILQQMHQANPEDFHGIDVSNTLQVSISQEQVTFFKEVISNHQGRIFLFLHEPAYQCNNEQFLEIEQCCEGKEYTIVCGHLHDFEHRKRNGHDAIQLQQTGGLPHGTTPDGVLKIEVGNDVTFTMLDLEGNVLPCF